jgi:uncharacterized protein (TIGR03085 family)
MIVHMTGYALAERLALANTMEQFGPDAPTLCTGWSVRDLAAHIVLRERRPDAAAGIVLRRVAPHTERVQARIAAGDFQDLLRRMRKRPWWIRPVDELMNVTEMFVHHEDVRRAQPGWAPRDLDDGLRRALFKQLRPLPLRGLRRLPAVVHVEAPRFGAVRGGGSGPDTVRISGDPGELLLFLVGRQSHAIVNLDGPTPLTEHLRRARLGI